MGSAVSKPEPVPVSQPGEPSQESSPQLGEQTSSQTPPCEKCVKPMLQIVPDEAFFIAQKQFNQGLEEVNSKLGVPVHWADKFETELTKFQQDLINCYKAHGGEPLNCANLAKEYHDFVFAKQFDSILDAKNRD